MKSPYTENESRLADVIAAIQVMSVYKFYKLDFDGWADRIVGDESKGSYWKKVFVEHPEFFRLDKERKRASLVWRRQRLKNYDVDSERELTQAEIRSLTEDQRQRISRAPLDPETTGTLIKTAIDLHARGLEHKQDNRWLRTLLITGAGGFLGALISGWVKG